MLPALGLSRLPMGAALLATLAVVLVRPRPGVVTHTVALAYAVAIDQTRLQPEVVSLCLLLWGTVGPTGLAVARVHLVALWTWSGINKILSPEFLVDGTQAGWMLDGLVGISALGILFAYVVAASELATGVLAAVVRTRRLAAASALVMHLSILKILGPLGQSWNRSIWPWNVALALSGLVLIAPWRESLWSTLRTARAPVAALLVLLLLAPAGFYAGVTDAYLAHNLYAGNAPAVAVCQATAGCRVEPFTGATWRAFAVPLPPERRLLRATFEHDCRPGEAMTVVERRSRFDSSSISAVRCPT
jgi:hypothetical protein